MSEREEPIKYDSPPDCWATADHVMFVHQNTLFIHGGRKYSRTCGQFITVDMNDGSVEKIFDANNTTYCRYGHSVVLHEEKAYFFGGIAQTETDTLLCFDVTSRTWNTILKNGDWPPELVFHTAILYNDKLYIFGGIRKDGNASNNLYEIDLTLFTSRVVHTTNAPTPRYGHVCYIADDTMHILGGYSTSRVIDPYTRYKYSFNTNTWELYKSDTPCGVFACITNTKQIIGGTLYKLRGLERLSSDELIVVLQFLSVSDLLSIDLVSRSFILGKYTKDDVLWCMHYDRLDRPLVPKQHVTHGYKKAYIDHQRKQVESLFHTDISKLDYPSRNKYIGLETLLNTPIDYSNTDSIRAVIIGDKAVGKSCTTYTMCNKWENTEFGNIFWTVDDVYHRIEGKEILFVETPCHEEYERFRRQKCKAASGTFSVTNSLVVLIYFNTYYKSADTSSVYSAIMTFLREVREETDSAPCILVGTKQDLRESEVEKFTFLPRSFGVHVARETGCLAYVEVSALTGYGIEALKQAVVRAPQYQAQSNKKKKCKQM